MEMRGMMGERLGVIGQAPGQLPQWKQDFLSKPSASVRKGIAWGRQQAVEDTSTLVLTAPSSTFIDIRFPIDAKSSDQCTNHPSFWAFSGKVSISFYDESVSHAQSVGLPYTAYAEFVHDIDTHGPGIVDAGDMCLLPNGNSLEFGHMVNPATGQDEPYKEYWCSAKHSSDSDGSDDSKICIVTHIINSSNTRGLAIRIGGYIQAVLSTREDGGAEKIHYERWTREPSTTASPVVPGDHPVQTVGWIADERSSGSYAPVTWLSSRGLKVGDKIEHSGLSWSLTEVHE